MTFTTKLKRLMQVIFTTLLFSTYQTHVCGQAEFLTDNVVNTTTNSINGDIFRNGRVSIGGTAFSTAGLPPDVKLLVKGRVAQEFTGNIGGFGSNDLWSSWGKSFAPVASIPQVYGTINQWGTSSFISGVKDGSNSVVSWAGTGSRLDFDYINSSFNPQTHMSILDNGNVGIGTTTPTEKLVVQGKGIFLTGNTGGASKPILQVGNPRRNNGTANMLYIAGFNTDNFWKIDAQGNSSVERLLFKFGKFDDSIDNTVMGFRENGSVGIKTSSPQCTFDVNGDLCALSVTVSSDKRYKKNIKEITNALDKINAIDGVSYQFRQEKINGRDFSDAKGKNHLGFIAQDLERIFPELVRQDENGYYSVNYDGLIPVLVEGMKEQQEVIVEQETEIQDLQSRMEKLEALINNLDNSQGRLPNTRENVDLSKGIVLKQNAPNPFKNKTTIQYELPLNLKTAQLIIYDLNGRILSSYNVEGKGVIEFDATSMRAGAYIYSIIIGDVVLATQRMVIQK